MTTQSLLNPIPAHSPGVQVHRQARYAPALPFPKPAHPPPSPKLRLLPPAPPMPVSSAANVWRSPTTSPCALCCRALPESASLLEPPRLSMPPAAAARRQLGPGGRCSSRPTLMCQAALVLLNASRPTGSRQRRGGGRHGVRGPARVWQPGSCGGLWTARWRGGVGDLGIYRAGGLRVGDPGEPTLGSVQVEWVEHRRLLLTLGFA